MLLLRSFKKYPDRSMVQQRTLCPRSHLSKSNLPSLSLRARIYHPNTRIYVRLLGPCYKTGRMKPFCQHLERVCGFPPSDNQQHTALLSVQHTVNHHKRKSPAEAHATMITSIQKRMASIIGLTSPEGAPPYYLCTTRWIDADQPTAKVPPPKKLLAPPDDTRDASQTNK